MIRNLPHVSLHELLAKTEVREIYVNRGIRSLAFGLIGIFVPIYLLKNSYSLLEIVLFLFALYAALGIYAFSAAILESKWGLKRVVLISTPILLVYFGLLFTIPYFRWPALLLGFVHGAEQALYWIPMNTKFAQDTARGKKGKQISYAAVIESVAVIVAPLLGGIVLSYYSFNVLVLAVVALILVSIVPFFMTKDRIVEAIKGWKAAFSKQNYVHFNQHFIFGPLLVCASAWAIYLFYIFDEYLYIGAISTAMGVCSAIFILWIGKMSDSKQRRAVIKIGAVANAIMWAFAFFAVSMWAVIAASLLQGFFYTMIALPLFTSACNTAAKQNTVEFMVMRETALCAGRVLALIPLLLLPTLAGLKNTLIIGIVASFMFLFSKLPD